MTPEPTVEIVYAEPVFPEYYFPEALVVRSDTVVLSKPGTVAVSHGRFWPVDECVQVQPPASGDSWDAATAQKRMAPTRIEVIGVQGGMVVFKKTTTETMSDRLDEFLTLNVIFRHVEHTGVK